MRFFYACIGILFKRNGLFAMPQYITQKFTVEVNNRLEIN